jgi:hypothetical protein
LSCSAADLPTCSQTTCPQTTCSQTWTCAGRHWSNRSRSIRRRSPAQVRSSAIDQTAYYRLSPYCSALRESAAGCADCHRAPEQAGPIPYRSIAGRAPLRRTRALPRERAPPKARRHAAGKRAVIETSAARLILGSRPLAFPAGASPPARQTAPSNQRVAQTRHDRRRPWRRDALVNEARTDMVNGALTCGELVQELQIQKPH